MIWQKIVELNPTPWNLLQYADQLGLSGKLDKAEEIVKNIRINDVPANFKFVYYVRMGMIYQDQYQIKKAIGEFKKSIKIGTEETYPYIFLAVLLKKQKKLEEAEKILLEALNKKGDIDEVYYNLSMIYARKENYTDAITMMKECLKIDINYPNAKAFLEDFENIAKIMKG